MPLRTRGCHPADLMAVAAQASQLLRESYEFVPPTADALASRLACGSLRILLVESDGALVGSAGTVCTHWGEEVEWLAVSASDAGLEAEDALLSSLEASPRAPRMILKPGAGTPELNRWMARGYVLDGGLLHAVAELSGGANVVPPPAGPGVVLRAMRPGETASVTALINGVYGWPRLADGELDAWTRRHPPFSPSWVQVADADGAIVSALAARPTRRAASEPTQARLHRARSHAARIPGRGLATALAGVALVMLAEHGMSSVALHAHESNRPIISLMETLGFRVTRHWKFLAKPVAGR